MQLLRIKQSLTKAYFIYAWLIFTQFKLKNVEHFPHNTSRGFAFYVIYLDLSIN